MTATAPALPRERAHQAPGRGDRLAEHGDPQVARQHPLRLGVPGADTAAEQFGVLGRAVGVRLDGEPLQQPAVVGLRPFESEPVRHGTGGASALPSEPLVAPPGGSGTEDLDRPSDGRAGVVRAEAEYRGQTSRRSLPATTYLHLVSARHGEGLGADRIVA